MEYGQPHYNNSGYGELAAPSFPQLSPGFPREEHLGQPQYPAEHHQQDPYAAAHPQGPYPGAPADLSNPLSPHIFQPQVHPNFPGPTSPDAQRNLMDFGSQAHLPPPAAPAQPPPSGYRVPLSDTTPFPSPQYTGEPPCFDADGSPVFIGSALMEKSVHPCKIAPHLQPHCRVPYGGGEFEHRGRFDLLPFSPNLMEWVPTQGGHVPPGRRPVEGGYEENGAKLYHALGTISGVHVPGKTGEHLGGANIAFGGGEHVVREYSILCWK
ncbi:hypothetical protein PUNSTDRAFT_86159 [Punctularia strigosozonata HHB-11173 SS5]|uniref:uncharacterized protein n=1 Tax=Punctularia strigosozonata (strain HHB-11173) TaxID=741275 RepID=UPI000441746B|nr:uncharacterized protein PUNSTDRAFT_86159 [Punctularia strigosozonata HHB-11173 SS5]EIN09696.1 hypothetical protein PUNSTDRAFT_86159 [Punctularia strigosozonata HHB-11173 SS5]